MKKAFTMLELVFVIVAIGILAATVIPNTKTNPLQEAATQLVSHIRYTQHLAMVDDKFDSKDSNWSKKMWSIRFYNGGNSDNEESYTIFSDKSGEGNPSLGEVAKDYENIDRVLSGGCVGSTALDITGNTFKGKEKLNLGLSYGVNNISFSGGCNQKVFTFDHLGRPMNGQLIKTICNITLNSSDDNITIVIEPETGYSHIL